MCNLCSASCNALAFALPQICCWAVLEITIQYLPQEFRGQHRTRFCVLFIIVYLLPECNQRSVRIVNKVAPAPKRMWLVYQYQKPVNSRWWQNVLQCMQCPEAFLKLPEAEHGHWVWKIRGICAHQHIKYVFFFFLAFVTYQLELDFVTYWGPILQFLRALILMACYKPHRIVPLGEKKL